MPSVPKPGHAKKVRKPVTRRNVARAAKNHTRAYGEKRAWIQTQPCCVCGYAPSEAAHVGTDGMGRKASSRRLIPLCGPHSEPMDYHRHVMLVGCHAESHRGIKTFEKRYAINLLDEAVKYEDRWLTDTLPDGDHDGRYTTRDRRP